MEQWLEQRRLQRQPWRQPVGKPSVHCRILSSRAPRWNVYRQCVWQTVRHHLNQPEAHCVQRAPTRGAARLTPPLFRKLKAN